MLSLAKAADYVLPNPPYALSYVFRLLAFDQNPAAIGCADIFSCMRGGYPTCVVLHVPVGFVRGHLFIVRIPGHRALGQRGTGQPGGEDGCGAQDRKTQSLHGTLPFL